MSGIAVHIENLSVYYGQTSALSDVRLDVGEGEYLGIIGPNGGGKSTLLKAILGCIPSPKGTVLIYGKEPGKSREIVRYVPQFSSLDKRFPITLFEVVLSGLSGPGLSPFFGFSKKDREKTFELLEKVGIRSLAKRQISELSGGQFQKMLIARALVADPKLLLLDEPTASVDAASRDQIYNLLSESNKKMTVILVTHDLLAISSRVHRLACLNNRLVYHGEPELSRDSVNALYGCPVDLIAHGVPHRMLGEHAEEKHID